MTEPHQESSQPQKSPGSATAQTVIGWILVLVAGFCALITLFTLPFVLAEKGTSQIPEALAFAIPEAVALVVGFWLLKRGKRRS